MGQPASRGIMCCSLRDKHGQAEVPDGTPPRFQYLEFDLEIDRPNFVSFAPVFQRQEVPMARRVAVASKKEVHVYRIHDADLMQDPKHSVTLEPTLPLAHSLKLESSKQIITSILFFDEDASRQLAVAFAPEPNAKGETCVRIWNCDTKSKESGNTSDEIATVTAWKFNDGYIASLDDHSAPVRCLATNRTYFLTLDDNGECRVWQKGRAFARRATGVFHQSSGVADLALDRLFAYSAGREDRRVCVWGLPALTPISVIPMDISEATLSWPCAPTNGVASSHDGSVTWRSSQDATVVGSVSAPAAVIASGTGASMQNVALAGSGNRLVRLSHIRRPLSRWAGWQGSSRGPKAPRGWLFVAGVLGDVSASQSSSSSAQSGLGVLVECSLGEKPSCHHAQVVHESPIAAMAYGPYDNGPLVTADAKGVFRVWELQLGKGLRFSQQLELLWLAPKLQELQIAVEQPRGLFVVSSGSKRLFVWQRYNDALKPF